MLATTSAGAPEQPVRPRPATRTRTARPSQSRIISQARLRGPVPCRVNGHTAEGSATGTPYLTVVLDGLMLVIEDRTALLTAVAAIKRAHDLADSVFGPLAPRERSDANTLLAAWAEEQGAARVEIAAREHQRHRDYLTRLLRDVDAEGRRLHDLLDNTAAAVTP